MTFLRTVLSVPGDRPDRIVKAMAAGADAIAIDFEDAVATTEKQTARRATTATLAAHDSPARTIVTVRINAADTAFAENDIEALIPVLGAVRMLIVPMSSSPDGIRAVSRTLDAAEARAALPAGQVRVIPLIETAVGIAEARAIAEADARVHTLAFGPADLSRELGVTPTAEGTELFVARSQIVLAAAAAGLPSPLDGPYLDLGDAEGLALSSVSARRLGFGGKQVIHPGQVATAAAAFAPSSDELDWARHVDEAFRHAEADGVSSIQLADGTFVDYPVARRARDLLYTAAQETTR